MNMTSNSLKLMSKNASNMLCTHGIQLYKLRLKIVYNAHTKELDEIQELIDKLNIENPFITEEYIQYDDSEVITDMISNEEILKVVFSNNNNHQKKGTEDSDPLPSITHNEAINYYDKPIRIQSHGCRSVEESDL
ncbi:uncharacterized protein OCT59_018798 [Rhizophagus irregularis]|uniref:uncharacterized protein n=1 Tax=Rhizophagus irregularis TaxID=588596 RepID=UPI00331A2DE9|nr:hypothetical protein OCT59_018798 [Rhizophagus irregularis]